MLSRSDLVTLFDALEAQDVLSVYVDADERDPAQRDAWKIRLTGEIGRLRKRVDAGNEGVAGRFEAAWERINTRIHSLGDGLPPGRGWIAFATPDRLHYAEGVPASMPDLVRWQKGIHAAPYIRALKQERPITVVLLDGRHARVFEQVEGEITEREGIMADRSLGDLTDVGMRKGSSRTSGMRGETATDQGQRLLDVAGERMRKELAEHVADLAGPDGIVVVGGPSESVRRFTTLLTHDLDGRVTEWPGLHLGMTAAEVKKATRAAAGELSESAHRELVSEVVDASRAGGKGTLGSDDTLRALREGRVDTLLLSRGFVHSHPGDADLAVGLAFSHGAETAEVSGEAGALLDEEADGMAARLRYRAEAPLATT